MFCIAVYDAKSVGEIGSHAERGNQGAIKLEPNPKSPAQGLEYVLLTGIGVKAPAATAASFAGLEEALSAIAQYQFQPADAVDGVARPAPQFEIVCRRPGETVRSGKKPEHQFYVNVRAADPGTVEGDGTEQFPWNGLNSAVAALLGRCREGSLFLKPGQRLLISHKEPFTPSALERWKKIKETAAKYVFLAMTGVLVLPVVLILGFLVIKAWPALSFSFLFQNPTNNMTAGGIWAPLIGTFFLVLLSLAIAAPIGVLAGVYLNEYARNNWFNRLISLAVVNLAGVPSIVHALFGVGAFVLFMHMGKSLLAASCTIAVMTLPVIITSTREALASVPMAFREACWNLGATRWQTIRTIVLPNSISGILTGVILQVSRAAGETAPILFTGAVFYMRVPDHGWYSFFPYGLHDKCMALSYHLFTLTTQVSGVSSEIQYGTAVVLVGLVLLLNSVSIGLRVYLRMRKKW
ncbi:MAG: phosphate ABC transporter permease PstA [Thermoguttaceae bacterium]|jgi:phosphate transport system permease protein